MIALEPGLPENVRRIMCDPREVRYELTSGAGYDYLQKLSPSGACETRCDRGDLLTGCAAHKLKRSLKPFGPSCPLLSEWCL